MLLLLWGAIELGIRAADYQQGNDFRIMYVHVPAAMLADLYIGIVAVFGLVWRMKLTDVAISACLPLGMVITALALFSGSVWGRPTWGSWWVDERTVSLVLFFLYVGIFALREAIAEAELGPGHAYRLGWYGQYSHYQVFGGVVNTLHQPSLV